MSEYLTIWSLLYLLTGLFTGLLAGLMGVGGGAVLVPVLVFMFKAQGFSENHLMLLALGTSMSTIIFTSLSSSYAHHRRGMVLWSIVAGITPGILIGTYFGTALARRVPTTGLVLFFSAFIFYMAVQLLIDKKPSGGRALPGFAGLSATGLGIGLISSLVAIGGGTLSVPFMMWCRVNMRHAIATSAAIGFPIAVGGTIGYLTQGWNIHDVPHGSLGFVYLPAVIPLAVASVLTAPLGAKLAHRLPVQTLRRIFAVILLLLVLKMMSSILF